MLGLRPRKAWPSLAGFSRVVGYGWGLLGQGLTLMMSAKKGSQRWRPRAFCRRTSLLLLVSATVAVYQDVPLAATPHRYHLHNTPATMRQTHPTPAIQPYASMHRRS